MPGILKIEFLRAPLSIALAKGKHIRAMLIEHDYHNGPLPEGVVNPDQLGEIIDRLQAADDDTLTHDTGKIKRRNKLRAEYNRKMKNLASHLEIFANGNPAKLENTGFDVRQTPKKAPATNKAVPAPEITLIHGGLSGTLIACIAIAAVAAAIELQIAAGDPSLEENWSSYAVCARTPKIEITGRTPGQNYWVRARGLGKNGFGPWSAPVCLMSL